MLETVHVPVLPAEVLALGDPEPGQIWIDGTAGGGGHARLIAEKLVVEKRVSGNPIAAGARERQGIEQADAQVAERDVAQDGAPGTLIAIDRDPRVVERLASELPANCVVKHSSYDDIPEVLTEVGIDRVDGILLDLGLSSDQLADRERGFSFSADGPLDMRFDMTQGEAAWEWLQRVDEKTLADTIYQYGEERFSRRIAKRIVDTRKENPIRNASELRELIYRSVPGKKHGRIDPATRTFQALRIAVNDELGILERALARLPGCLKPGGALLIISFHSLEDRLVKYAFRNNPDLEIVTRRPVQATSAETDRNSRSRSAKMRVARRIGSSGDLRND